MEHTVRYKYRVYPNKTQQDWLSRCFAAARIHYNDNVYHRRRCYENPEEYPDKPKWDNLLNVQAKLEEPSDKWPVSPALGTRVWFNDVPNCVIQKAGADANTALKNFFNSLSGKRKGPRVGAPTFKPKTSTGSAYFTRLNHKVAGNRLKLAKLDTPLKLKLTRAIPSPSSSVTIVKDAAARYWASFVVCVEHEAHPRTRIVRGMDVGLSTLAVLDDGQKYPGFKPTRPGRMTKLDKSLARKKKGSNNYRKAKLKRAKEYARLVDARNDMQHHASKSIVLSCDKLALESLNVNSMKTHRRRNKLIADQAVAEFIRKVRYKSEFYGTGLIEADKHFPSTRMCSACGELSGPKGDVTVREWLCPCGVMHDRDVNAAKNLVNLI